MSTERISVPDVLAKPRDHAVICTFGADLAFYEGPLWRHIARARNRVVLADDLMLARQMGDLAAGGSRLRHVNINYLVSPITNPRRAHAKLILLTDAIGGTLLIGSGNVGLDGYASRGEAFCRYDISADDTAHLGAFQAAKNFLDTMAVRGYLDAQAIQHLEHMWSDTPWIWATAADGLPPVRHNLNTPLADQLLALVGNEQVTDIAVHAPFHDPGCETLRRLLTSLRPDHATVIVQERHTCVDPQALARVLQTCRAQTDVFLAAAPDFPATYLHAKFILIRTQARSITLVGSANLSLAALYRTDRPIGSPPPGNIELVNLLEGPPQNFDDFLAGLDLTEPTSPVAELDVHYHRDDESASDDEAYLQLRRGVWRDGVLLLEAANPLPEGQLTLVIAGTDASAALEVNAETISGRPGSEAAALLDSKAVPVWLRISTPDGPLETTPVYPYHLASLASMLTGRRDPDLLRKTGSLDLEVHDEELTALLDELDAALVIDRQSLWRLAGRSVPAESSDGPRLRWEDIDFDVLRRHPKLAQYQSAMGRRTDQPETTDLQVVLTAITEHFHGIGQQPRPGAESADGPPESPLEIDVDDLPGTLPSDRSDIPGDESPEEIEAKDQEAIEEREHRRLRIETRNRLAWQRFCDRFIRAIQDPEFTDLVGPNVTVTNAVIFNHLLALLIAKEVVAADRGITHQLQLWAFLWGTRDHQDGYLDALDEDTRFDAMEAIAERGGESVIVAAVHLADQLTRSNRWTELRTDLRNMWRHLLESPLLTFTANMLRHAASPGTRSAADISRELDKLAREWTTSELHAAIANHLGTTAGQIRAERVVIRRGLREEGVDSLMVDDPAASLDTTGVLAAFAEWAALDQSRTYFRLGQPAAGIVAVWDLAAHECWRYDRHTDADPVTLEEPVAAEPIWSAESRKLLDAARVADRKVA